MADTIKFTPRNPTLGWLNAQAEKGTAAFYDFCKMANSDAATASRWLAVAVRLGYGDCTLDKLGNADLEKIISETSKMK